MNYLPFVQVNSPNSQYKSALESNKESIKHAVTIKQLTKKATAVFLLYIIKSAKKEQTHSGYVASSITFKL